MKRFQFILASLVTITLLATILCAQTGVRQQLRAPGLPYFSSKIFSTFSEDGNQRLTRVYIQIVNDNLTFLQVDSGYRAEVQIEVMVSSKDSDFGVSRTLTESFLMKDYESTNAKSIVNTLITEIPIEAGEYEALITLRDMNSSGQTSARKKFGVLSSEGAVASDAKLMISDILFFNQFEKDEQGRIVDFDPALENSFSSDGESIYAVFNSYTSTPGQPLTIDYVVRDEYDLVVLQNQLEIASPEQYATHYIRLNRYYFNKNRYYMQVALNSGGTKISNGALFQFFWEFLPNSQKDLNLAIKQLKYIAKNDSINFFLKQPFAEKKAFFKRFWESRDPNPSTEENELMKEYYRRVGYSNQQFSISGESGWFTDRGRIFIKFGQPDDVEHHPFEAGSYPYVIWRYYDNRKSFLFIDRTGFGNYELHPEYYYVEYE